MSSEKKGNWSSNSEFNYHALCMKVTDTWWVIEKVDKGGEKMSIWALAADVSKGDYGSFWKDFGEKQEWKNKVDVLFLDYHGNKDGPNGYGTLSKAASNFVYGVGHIMKPTSPSNPGGFASCIALGACHGGDFAKKIFFEVDNQLPDSRYRKNTKLSGVEALKKKHVCVLCVQPDNVAFGSGWGSVWWVDKQRAPIPYKWTDGTEAQVLPLAIKQGGSPSGGGWFECTLRKLRHLVCAGTYCLFAATNLARPRSCGKCCNINPAKVASVSSLCSCAFTQTLDDVYFVTGEGDPMTMQTLLEARHTE